MLARITLKRGDNDSFKAGYTERGKQSHIIQGRMTETHYEVKECSWTCTDRNMWNSNLGSVIGGYEIIEMKW